NPFLLIVAHVGQEITLPCRYDSSTNGEIPVCWGRGEIPLFGCRDELLATDGTSVKEESRASSRYQLLGRLDKGDVSLTIRDVREEDAGMYGCRVKIPGMFNDEKYYVDLSVVKAEEEPSTSENNKAAVYRQNQESSSMYGII
uniref:Ig-like domain-containing protein n=1 Tax=Oryzias melastigma TaxID=30732 RepID=A0A3B3CFB1_ORYME